MLTVDDVLAEIDVLALDSTVLDTFGPDPAEVSIKLRDKRTFTVQGWLSRRLEAAQLPPVRHSLRYTPSQVWGYTGAAYADRTSAASDKTVEDVDLSVVLASPSDALYIGFYEPFRGVYAAMQDNVNTNSLTSCSVTYWNGGRWQAFTSLANATFIDNSIAFSGGGMLRWQPPSDWQKRPVNNESTWRYWVRVSLGRAPSVSTKVTALLPLRRSRLTEPAARYALSLLYTESWGHQRGEWDTKAKAFETAASDGLAEVLGLVLDEFTSPDEEAVDPDAINDVAADVQVDPFTWFRG